MLACICMGAGEAMLIVFGVSVLAKLGKMFKLY